MKKHFKFTTPTPTSHISGTLYVIPKTKFMTWKFTTASCLKNQLHTCPRWHHIANTDFIETNVSLWNIPRLFKEAGMKLLEGHVDVDVQCAEHHKWKSILLSCIGVSRVGYLQPWTNKTKGMYIYIYICMAKVAIEHSSLRHWIPPSSRASDPEV